MSKRLHSKRQRLPCSVDMYSKSDPEWGHPTERATSRYVCSLCRYIADLPLDESPSQADMGEFLALRFMELIRGGEEILKEQMQQQREAEVAAVTNAEEGVDAGLPRKDGNLP